MSSRLDRVLLIGMMGAGKTTIGRELGTLLGWPVYDNDELVARAAGKSTRRVLEEDGQPTLRRAEAGALDLALTLGAPLVAGVAGGVVTDVLNLDRMHRGGFVVWLRADLATLVKRVKGSDRPWLGEHADAAMRTLAAGRMALYAESADLVLDEDCTTPALLARRIAAELATARAVSATARQSTPWR